MPDIDRWLAPIGRRTPGSDRSMCRHETEIAQTWREIARECRDMRRHRAEYHGHRTADARQRSFDPGLSDLDRDNLAQTAAKMAVLVTTPERIRRVCEDLAHFQGKVEPNGFKGQIVTFDRESCLLYNAVLDRLLPPEASESEQKTRGLGVDYLGNFDDGVELYPAVLLRGLDHITAANCLRGNRSRPGG
ncbi:hypothetical protein, partial [uncultured Thiodictyon sp.]|uniref:hypothetical protein n=1 Tax=uncultured Thiodictyon sp. TaxID=1846217 RepID=UPI0025DBCCDA